MAQGLNALLGNAYELRLIDGDIASAIDETVALALITQVDYCSGRLHDMKKLNVIAQRAGTRILWDLSHSAGAVPVSLNADGAELAVGCGYKYLNGGPGAPAFLYVAAALQAQLSTPLAGWFGHVAPFAFDPDYRLRLASSASSAARPPCWPCWRWKLAWKRLTACRCRGCGRNRWRFPTCSGNSWTNTAAHSDFNAYPRVNTPRAAANFHSHTSMRIRSCRR